MKISLILFVLLNALLLPYGLNLPQENPEELFLSDTSLNELKEMKKDFGHRELVFVSGVKTDQTVDLMDAADPHGAEYSSLAPMLESQGVLNLPAMKDHVRYQFFKGLKEKFPTISFAGEAYTNAELAGMSEKIQKVLFPMVFGLILFGLVILVRKLSTAAYLFLSSLLGVGVGLAVVKVMYQHSTILTTLTPLICFILTLGVQLHVVYGMTVFKDLKTFFHHKLHALLIMMITTLIGFASLITSDLECIRQLSVCATLSLAITWGLLLLILNFTGPDFEVAKASKLQSSLKIPTNMPVLGYILLVVLTIGGVLGILRMPVLVEAIHFFPKGHDIHRGYQAIKKDLGGTPQFDLIVRRKDRSDLSYDDYLRILSFESELDKEFGEKKFLSLNHLVSFANEKYSGSKSLPDNSFAYEALSSRIPEILRKFQTSEKAYRISYISELLDGHRRGSEEKRLASLFSKLPSDYEVRFSGMTHLLLESQSHLVSSLITSFMTSFVSIVFIFALFSRKPKEIFIFAFLNFASILGGIMCMWLSGFSLNVSSIMTASISMGMVVDSTVHLLYAERMNESEENLFRSTLIPIIFAHILLFFGFAVLSFEGFVPIRDFALGLIYLLGVGLLCDLYVLPMITKLPQKNGDNISP